MKRFILTAFAMFFIAGTILAQCPPRQVPRSQASAPRDPEAPAVCLESFEMCNNWARHYCSSGSHEARANEKLRQMKERGVTITTQIIMSIAKRTPK
jgi:hypothetical protein